jgi:2-haloacid dehalogenase
MNITRREFAVTAAGAIAAGCSTAPATLRPPAIRAIAFDAFPIFDPRPIGELAESLFPGRGRALMDAWRTRQFEYQWLRALAGQYADFPRTTLEGLRFAAAQLQLDLTAEREAGLMDAYSSLKVWPDTAPAIARLRDANIRLAFLSNMTRSMLENGLRAAGLQDSFEKILSTDSIRSYKPDRRAYQMALDAFRLKREEILFVPFAGWDAAGAKWFGYRTFWVNRSGSPMEELGVTPDGAGRDLASLVAYALGESGRDRL